ncbi:MULTISPECIES: Nramp family divalent metal transporter [unclassified Deinococcus]|uniref:Nramp family divalent metal transporter n=1 Tax=unclassified Deinococcus TaxID=2623546 RepID=UPI0006DC0A64|nr:MULTISPECIES: Nramp family divalent metal transporter [unclassified Deinococcus]MCD0157212.1 Nramp family divalent metal transporter [Deinococcus sp. 6GRE01]MCD0175460.1 Nramp family divalent metal transporter [Deinococcus sp. 14RED07]PIG98684.1 iron transporter [Deinococcus sp. UR1]
MSDLNSSTDSPPQRWQVLGPGLLVAATGVGAADLVATLVAGSKYGYALLWAAVLGCVLKIVLVEGAGRYSLATGRTIFEGWQSLGRWTSWYFGPYIVLWGFVYGAAAMSGTGLPLHSLFPALSVTTWGILCGLAGFALVWWGRYALFERVMAVMVGLMFVAMVGAAALTLPNLPALLRGLVPSLPDGSLINVLSVAGGVGGTITLAAYGYWLREKGWHTPQFMRVMRLDNNVAYIVTGLFVVSTLIVGAELLYSSGIAIASGDKGLLSLADVLAERYGPWAGKVFLVGFASAAMSSLLGVWNGVSLMFADFVGRSRGLASGHADTRVGGRYYRWYILWLTFPPMVMMFAGQPVALILAYGVLGALFMPFLAVTLLWLLNTDRTPQEWRNRAWSNAAMAVCTLIFTVLAVTELAKQLAKLG